MTPVSVCSRRVRAMHSSAQCVLSSSSRGRCGLTHQSGASGAPVGGHKLVLINLFCFINVFDVYKYYLHVVYVLKGIIEHTMYLIPSSPVVSAFESKKWMLI